MNVLNKIIGSIADKLFPHVGVRMVFSSQETMTAFIEAHSETHGKLFELRYSEGCSIQFKCSLTMYVKLCEIKRELPALVNEVCLI